MQPHTTVRTLARLGLAGMLLLSSGGRLLAQDVDGPPADSAETAAVPMGAEFDPESAASLDVDPNASATAEEQEEDRGDTTAAGPAATEDPSDLEAIDNPEIGPDSMAAGPEITENGEMAAMPSGDHLLFIPSIMTAGPPESTDTGAALEMAAAGGAMHAASGQSVMGDFNGDGRSDLAVSVPFEDIVVGGVNVADAGAVNVIYGTATGLKAAGNQVWTQDSAGITNSVEAGDTFGWALAAGNFNGDAFDDLAIGVPYEDLAGQVDVGAVHILYGTAAGLAAAGSQFWTQDNPSMLDISEAGDLFGAGLTSGDFNGDGRDDLVISVLFENIGTVNNGGLLQILYGTARGLRAAGNQVWTQNSAGIADYVEADDLFGYALAVGNFDADSYQDLAVGTPHEDVGALVNAGAVQIIRGGASGLAAAGSQLFNENSAGIVGYSEANDYFGWALASGDFNGNGASDLAVGVPYEDYGTLINAGTVNVIYGVAGTGLGSAGNKVWNQNVAGIRDVGENGDVFGYSLAAALFSDDVSDDLAVGVPYEDTAGLADTGAVNVLYGSGAGLVSVGNQFWTQNTTGVLDTAEADDQLGLALVVGDFNGNTRSDLVIGVPYEDVGAVQNMGAVSVIYGPLGRSGNQFWSQDSAGILDAGEENDYFGYLTRNN